MSILALELLRSLDLLDADNKPANISRFSDNDLWTALTSYVSARTHSLGHEIEAEASERKTLAAMRSSVSSRNGVGDLLPSAFVYDRVFADDPLLKEVRPQDDYTEAYNQSLGLPAQPRIDRKDVAQALAHFSALAPLIRAKVIHVLPISVLHRRSD